MDRIYVEEGRGTAVEASKLYKVSFKSVYNWIEQKREKGSLKPNKPSSTRHRKINKEDLKKYVQKHPDHYLREIAVVFNVSSGAIFKALKSMQITFKKNSTLQRKRRESAQRISRKNRIDC
ncbi:MAG: transposase [Chthoniobacterales bacterium]|nr:transposase [Chthoniobacterales bacterium]